MKNSVYLVMIEPDLILKIALKENQFQNDKYLHQSTICAIKIFPNHKNKKNKK